MKTPDIREESPRKVSVLTFRGNFMTGPEFLPEKLSDFRGCIRKKLNFVL